MTVPTDDDILELVTLLALNYGKALDDEFALAALVKAWREQIGGCTVEDIHAARVEIMGDPNVRYMPAVGEFRARVLGCNRRRHAALREAAGQPTVACLTCLDSGWVDQGLDEDGTWWVRKCPNECVPPLYHHRTRPRAFTAGRRGPGQPEGPQQLRLSPEALVDAVAGTRRMLGERDDPLNPF